jgi:hypothetical protein
LITLQCEADLPKNDRLEYRHPASLAVFMDINLFQQALLEDRLYVLRAAWPPFGIAALSRLPSRGSGRRSPFADFVFGVGAAENGGPFVSGALLSFFCAFASSFL